MKTVIAEEQLTFLSDLREYLDGLDPQLVEAARAENIEDPMQPRTHCQAFLRQLGKDGWLGISWPKEFGGQGRTDIEHWLFAEELYNRRLPNGLLTFNVVGPTIMLHGNPDQQREYISRIMDGEIIFAISYSEPDAGSDLASLRTKAVADGDEYVISGQKIWSTGASIATHLWVAARTGSPEDRHRGLSLFIIPADSPGISITPIITQGGERTTSIFFDDVRVPATQRLGEENDGWKTITAALNFERMFYHNEPRWELRQLAEWAGAAGLLDGTTAESFQVQTVMGEHAVDVEICRLMALRGAAMLAAGEVPYAEASANKVWWGELRQNICSTGLDLIGAEGVVVDTDDAPANGHLVHGLMSSPVWRFGGGTNEIQLDIIANRGWGMPR